MKDKTTVRIKLGDNTERIVRIYEPKLRQVFDLMNAIKIGSDDKDIERKVIAQALPLVCDMPLSDIVELPMSDIETIIDAIKKANKSLVKICNETRQTAILSALLDLLGRALSKVIGEMYFPDLTNTAKQMAEESIAVTQ